MTTTTTTTTIPAPLGHMTLKNVRLAFPSLFKPEAFQPGDEEKYKATFLVPKGSPQAAEIEKVIFALLQATLPQPGKAEQMLKSIRGNANKFCWQDGDLKAYDGFEGNWALSAKATVRPGIYDNAPEPRGDPKKPRELTEREGKLYGGCYVNAKVQLFVYDNPSIGVSARVTGVQYAGEGDAFGGGRPARADEFDVVEGATASDFA